MQRRSILNDNLRSPGSPKGLHRARKMPEFPLRRRRIDVTTPGSRRHRRRTGADGPRSRHHPREILNSVMTIEIVANAAGRNLPVALRRLLAASSLRLAPLQDRQKRRRPDAAIIGRLGAALPRPEEGDRDGSRAGEGGLAGGGRGGGGRRRRRGDARAGARVVAIGAERVEALAEAGGADAVAASLGGVFWAFPDLLFFHVTRH